MKDSIDGFYATYLSAAEGQDFALFVLRKGKIVGADAIGIRYNGTYTTDQENGYHMQLCVNPPANLPLIQGRKTGSEGDAYNITFEVPSDFLLRDFIRIEDKDGPINAKIIKLDDLDD